MYRYCRNGHYIGTVDPTPRMAVGDPSLSLEESDREYESSLQPFCTECGARIISRCQHCQERIDPSIAMKKPAFCGRCGRPFPWTEIALQSAMEFTDELGELNADDKVALKETFEYLVVDTARTPLAASRFKRIVGTLAPTAKDILTKIIVEVATQAAKTGMGL